MTQEEQRIAIAEARGWKPPSTDIPQVRADGSKEYDSGAYWTTPSGVKYWKDCPDCLNDLNEIHEAVAEAATKDPMFKLIYLLELQKIVCPSAFPGMDVFPCVEATAAQRAEAFLRTLGLWKE